MNEDQIKSNQIFLWMFFKSKSNMIILNFSALWRKAKKMDFYLRRHIPTFECIQVLKI